MANTKNHFKVLLVEDDEEDYFLTKSLLSEVSEKIFHLDWVKNYTEGLEWIAKNEHDVCLIDYRIGEHTGIDLILASIKAGYSVPIILLTGQNDADLDLEAIHAGAMDYLVKGRINSESLDRSIRYSIERAKYRDELEKLIEALRVSEKSALAASQLKSEFLANMSHEIRTPINGVLGMIHLLSDTELTLKQKDYVENVKRSADALLTVVNDILDFSKIEAGKLELEMIEFDLDTLILDIGKAISFNIHQKDIVLNMPSPLGLNHLVKGDQGRLRQVFLNLLTNAVKFTLKGKIDLRIIIEKQTESQIIFKFEVADTGIGINEQALERMFQAFSQADSSTTRRFGGTGLGLSICKKLVELMNGEIGVMSESGKGSTFWFNVPLGISNLQQINCVETKLIIESTVKLERILVAEDNYINQKVALGILEKLGYKAFTVANGVEVLDALRDVHYDLILMDCQMPEKDGYETTIDIRNLKTSSYTDIPIIAMTANAIKGDRERCLEAGMNDYIAKPINFHELATTIEKWIKKKPMPRAG